MQHVFFELLQSPETKSFIYSDGQYTMSSPVVGSVDVDAHVPSLVVQLPIFSAVFWVVFVNIAIITTKAINPITAAIMTVIDMSAFFGFMLYSLLFLLLNLLDFIDFVLFIACAANQEYHILF